MIIDTSRTVELDGLIAFRYKLLRTSRNFVELRRLPKGPTVKLDKNFKVDKECAWIAGFYFAEGSKLKASIGISNCNTDFVLRFKTFIDKTFNTDRTRWLGYIRTKKILSAQLKSYYESLLGMKITLYYNKLATNDAIEIRFNNVVFTEIFHSLLRDSIKIVFEDKALILEFLKGYEVGDGSINVRSTGCLHDINITVKNSEMKNTLKLMFYELYKIKLNERQTNGAYEIYYSNVKGMIDIILDGHFRDYKAQWDKLRNGFLNKEYVRSHIRYWKVIDSPLPVLKIAENTSRSHWSVRDALNYDVRLGLVNVFDRNLHKSGPPNKFYILSEKGEKLVKILAE